MWQKDPPNLVYSFQGICTADARESGQAGSLQSQLGCISSACILPMLLVLSSKQLDVCIVCNLYTSCAVHYIL